MSNILEPAELFFEACENGKGWEHCKKYCHTDASFSSQTTVLAEISTVEGYTEWMKGLFTPIPDAHYELLSFSADDANNTVTAYGVFKGTQTGEGGPIPPTGKSISADYVYAMVFESDKIKHLTKIWNDTISLQQLGWG